MQLMSMINKIIVFCCLWTVFSCNEFSGAGDGETAESKRKLPPGMKYSYECLKSDSGKVSDVWGKADDLLSKVATFNIEVTDDEQMKFGDTFLLESAKDKNFQID